MAKKYLKYCIYSIFICIFAAKQRNLYLITICDKMNLYSKTNKKHDKS